MSKFHIKSSNPTPPRWPFSPHSTSAGRGWNTLHKSPTGQINPFLFFRLPSQPLIQLPAAALCFNKHAAVTPLCAS